MPHQRFANISEYVPFHLTTAAATGTPIGTTQRVNTTSTSTIAVGLSQPFVPASFAGLYVNQVLLVYGGVGTAEVITISRIDKVGGFCYANFANTHSGTWNIQSVKGTYLGPIVVNKVGSAETLTLYQANPAATGAPAPYIGAAFAIITPAAGTPYPFGLWLPYGLYYTYAATTAGDYTIHYLDEP